jgi:hypothetical protein
MPVSRAADAVGTGRCRGLTCTGVEWDLLASWFGMADAFIFGNADAVGTGRCNDDVDLLGLLRVLGDCVNFRTLSAGNGVRLLTPPATILAEIANKTSKSISNMHNTPKAGSRSIIR